MKLQLMLVAYGLVNAVLYSAILPLWEGFDEPFHFGYVQCLANGQGFPDPRKSFLSREASLSILIAPASSTVKHNLPRVITYSDYFSSPRFQRAAVERRLRELPLDARWERSDFFNYEAHQAPLAYMLLALPERALARITLPARVLVLRLIGALTGTLLLYFGARRLFSELGMRDDYKSAAIFCLLSCQMTWATMAHVANDWLAVPLTVWSLALIVGYRKSPRLWTAAAAATVVSIGLLTKAYFLALIPVAFGVWIARKSWRELCFALAIILLTAGPWYTRNALRYGTLTGMQESRAGIGLLAVIRAAPALNWPSVAVTSVRSALWTGNNSFTSFSSKTLLVIVAFWLVALILWARGRNESAEWVVISYCAAFVAALMYITVVSYVYTQGAANGPSPWYWQPLVTPSLGLAFLGCSRSHRIGSGVATMLTVLFGYVMIATYVVKLIPLYGGYQGRTSFTSLANMYANKLPLITDNLDLLCLAPARIVFGLVTMVIAMTIMQVFALVRLILMKRSNGLGTSAGV